LHHKGVFCKENNNLRNRLFFKNKKMRNDKEISNPSRKLQRMKNKNNYLA